MSPGKPRQPRGDGHHSCHVHQRKPTPDGEQLTNNLKLDCAKLSTEVTTVKLAVSFNLMYPVLTRHFLGGTFWRFIVNPCWCLLLGPFFRFLVGTFGAFWLALFWCILVGSFWLLLFCSFWHFLVLSG